MKKGEKMLAYGILFGFVILFALVGLYILDHANKGPDLSAIVETNGSIKLLRQDLDTMVGAVNKLAVTDSSNELRIREILTRLADVEKESDAQEENFLHLREQAAKFNDRLSRKRPVIKVPTGPIAVEIYEGKPRALGKGMKAVLKDAR